MVRFILYGLILNIIDIIVELFLHMYYNKIQLIYTNTINYLEAYFQQLSLRLGRTYVGTAIKGGVEGLQIRPAKSQEKIIEPMVNSIVNLMSEGSFNQNDIFQLAKPIKLGKGMEILFKVFSKLGLVNFFWNQQLKEKNAYEKRFDCPYLCLNKGSTKSEIL